MLGDPAECCLFEEVRPQDARLQLAPAGPARPGHQTNGFFFGARMFVMLVRGWPSQDVKQGSLGDCWLMSALSCLADHPQKLKSLFSTKHITKEGGQGLAPRAANRIQAR